MEKREVSNPPSYSGVIVKPVGFGKCLITSKVLDVRRRGATTEAKKWGTGLKAKGTRGKRRAPSLSFILEP
jgi:hypothetical protein